MEILGEWSLYAFYVLEYTDGNHEYRISKVLEIIDGRELSAEQAQDLLFKEEVSKDFGEDGRIEKLDYVKRVWDDDDSRVLEIIDFRIISKSEYLILAKYLKKDKIGKRFNPSIRKEKVRKEK
jgi:hypothetical protein